jgi:hypothetical protein
MSVTAPTSDYWRDFSEEPEDFDAEKVWKYTSKYASSKGSPRSGCPWCLKKFSGLNSTKALFHQAAVTGQENRPLPWSFQWHAANLVHCVSSGINRPEESAISQESAGPCRIARLTIRTATQFFSVSRFTILTHPLYSLRQQDSWTPS